MLHAEISARSPLTSVPRQIGQQLDSLRPADASIQAVQQGVAGSLHMDKPRHRQPLQINRTPATLPCPGQPMNLPPDNIRSARASTCRTGPSSDGTTVLIGLPRSMTGLAHKKYAPDHIVAQ